MKTGNHSINEIAKNVNIHRNTARNIIQNDEKEIGFISAGEKRKKACVERNATLDNKEQCIYNAVACNNSYIQNEIKEIVQESGFGSISRSTISRKLKK